MSKLQRMTGLLVVMILATMPFMGQTLAKYVTTVQGTDGARVAYWGFTEDGKADDGATLEFDMFSSEYKNGNFIAVQAQGGQAANRNLIAPGTSQAAQVRFRYTGNTAHSINAPEVAYSFEVTAALTGDETLIAALDNNPSFYWTYKAPDGEKVQKSTRADFLAYVNSLDGSADGAGTIQPGNLPQNFSTEGFHEIGWEWTFEVNDAGNVTDTDMGDAEFSNLTFTLTIRAEQLD